MKIVPQWNCSQQGSSWVTGSRSLFSSHVCFCEMPSSSIIFERRQPISPKLGSSPQNHTSRINKYHCRHEKRYVSSASGLNSPFKCAHLSSPVSLMTHLSLLIEPADIFLQLTVQIPSGHKCQNSHQQSAACLLLGRPTTERRLFEHNTPAALSPPQSLMLEDRKTVSFSDGNSVNVLVLKLPASSFLVSRFYVFICSCVGNQAVVGLSFTYLQHSNHGW